MIGIGLKSRKIFEDAFEFTSKNSAPNHPVGEVMNESFDLDSQFITQLAAAAPTPGGGGAAGMTGMLAAALAQMVAGLSLGRRKYEEHHPELDEILKKAQQIQADFEQAVNDDAHVYKRVITVLSHQNDKNEKATTQAIEDALVGAAQVPLGVIQLSGQLVEVCERLIDIGLEHARADAAAAIFLAQGVSKTSLINIKANMREVTDNKLKTSWINKATRIVKKINETAEQVEEKLSTELSVPRSDSRQKRRRRKRS